MQVLTIVSAAIVFVFYGLNAAIFAAWIIAAVSQPGSWERVRFNWEPRDLWIGVYYKADARRFTLYVCPLPAMVLRVVRNVHPPEGETGEAWTEMLETLPDGASDELERQRREHGRTALGVPPPVPRRHPEDCDCPGCVSGGGPAKLPPPAPGRLYEFP